MEFTEDQLSWGKAIQGILDVKKSNIKITLLSDSKGVWLYSKCVDSSTAHRYCRCGGVDTRVLPEHTADKIIRFWDRRPSTPEPVMTRADIPCPCDPGGSRLNCPYHRDVRLACEEPDTVKVPSGPVQAVPEGPPGPWGSLPGEYFVVKMDAVNKTAVLSKSFTSTAGISVRWDQLESHVRGQIAVPIIGEPVRVRR